MFSQNRASRNDPQNSGPAVSPSPKPRAVDEENLKAAQTTLHWCEQGVINCEDAVRDAMLEFEKAGEIFVSSGGTLRAETALEVAIEKVAEEQGKLLVVRRGLLQARVEATDAQDDFDAAVRVDGGRNWSQKRWSMKCGVWVGERYHMTHAWFLSFSVVVQALNFADDGGHW